MAALDRFFFNLLIDYPDIGEEGAIVKRTTGRDVAQTKTILDAEHVREFQEVVLDVPVPDHVLDYVLKLVHRTRPTSDLADEMVKNYVEWGAGPRASQNITRAAKALALLRGNPAASVEEVNAVARPVLRHRVIPNYNATGDGITVESILNHLLESD